ncbi:hypothetical protein llap_18542 [Limosa lapponica baueri]|uniref:Uncharacterized protein n=1 Tax=Limosa lapponica baueri TaxID=1758121 RepID=A0A2I0TBI2_LIMLA|nr:hypothetical protein llap_18542 [Limosa lapponica baueri]
MLGRREGKGEPILVYGFAGATPEIQAVQHLGLQLLFLGIAILLSDLPLAPMMSLDVDTFHKCLSLPSAFGKTVSFDVGLSQTLSREEMLPIPDFPCGSI